MKQLDEHSIDHLLIRVEALRRMGSRAGITLAQAAGSARKSARALRQVRGCLLEVLLTMHDVDPEIAAVSVNERPYWRRFEKRGR